MKIFQPTTGGGGGGGIGGSIAVTQIAYGSGANTITGDTNATRDPSTFFTNITTPFVFIGQPVANPGNSGNNDISVKNIFTGVAGTVFTITINQGDPTNPNTFDWTNSNGGGATSVAITGSNQPLNDGIGVRFNSTTGHTAGDSWTITASTATTGFQTTNSILGFPVAGASIYNTNADGQSTFFSGNGQALGGSDITSAIISLSSDNKSGVITVDANNPNGDNITAEVDDGNGAGAKLSLGLTNAKFQYQDSLGGGYGIIAADNGLAMTSGGSFLYNMPQSDGSAGYVMTTDGAGNTSFQPGGTVAGSGTTNQVAYWVNSTTLASDSNFTWDPVSFEFGVGDSANNHIKLNSTEIENIITGLSIFSIVYGTDAIFTASNNAGASILMGDIAGSIHGTTLQVTDISEQIIAKANSGFIVGDQSGDQWLNVDPSTSNVALGNLTGGGNATSLEVDDANELIKLHGQFTVMGNGNNNPWLQASDITRTASIGDINGAYNRTDIEINDQNQTLYINNSDGGISIGDVYGATTNTQMRIAPGANQTFQFLGLYDGTPAAINFEAKWLNNGTVGHTLIGDITLVGNKTVFELNDVGLEAHFQLDNQFYISNTLGHLFFSIEPTNGLYKIGDLNNTANGTQTIIDDTISTINNITGTQFKVTNSSGARFLGIQPGPQQYSFGDIDNSANHTWFNIMDATGQQKMHLYATNGMDVTDPLTSDRWFDIIPSASIAGMGDIDGTNNHTLLKVDDSSQTITASTNSGFSVTSGGNSWFNVNPGGAQGYLGAMGFGTGTNIGFNDATPDISFGYNGHIYLDFDFVGKIYKWGDIQGINFGTIVSINDNVGNIINTGTIVDAAIGSTTYGGTLNYSSGFGGKSSAFFSGSHSGTATGLLLPTGVNAVIGTKFTIDDLGGLATTDPITVDAGTGNTITSTTGTAQTFVINSNGESLTIKKLTSTAWMVE